MSRTIAPGQTVPIPFTLSDTPDSAPIVAAVEQATPDGVVEDVTSTVSPAVTQRGVGLQYYAWFTVPTDAEHGTAYTITVAVAIVGETTFHDLDGGSVELWASQASVTANGTAIAGVQTTANAIKAKTDLLGTGAAQLTQGGVTVGGTIIFTVASTCAGTLTGVGDLSAASKVWLTIKFRDSDADSAALLQIEKTAGLLRIAGGAVESPVDAADGSIDVSVADQFTFRLEDRAAALLDRYRETNKLVYDVKVDDGTDVGPVVAGAAELRYPVTRAVA